MVLQVLWKWLPLVMALSLQSYGFLLKRFDLAAIPAIWFLLLEGYWSPLSPLIPFLSLVSPLFQHGPFLALKGFLSPLSQRNVGFLLKRFVIAAIPTYWFLLLEGYCSPLSQHTPFLSLQGFGIAVILACSNPCIKRFYCRHYPRLFDSFYWKDWYRCHSRLFHSF